MFKQCLLNNRRFTHHISKS